MVIRLCFRMTESNFCNTNAGECVALYNETMYIRMYMRFNSTHLISGELVAIIVAGNAAASDYCSTGILFEVEWPSLKLWRELHTYCIIKNLMCTQNRHKYACTDACPMDAMHRPNMRIH